MKTTVNKRITELINGSSKLKVQVKRKGVFLQVSIKSDVSELLHKHEKFNFEIDVDALFKGLNDLIHTAFPEKPISKEQMYKLMSKPDVLLKVKGFFKEINGKLNMKGLTETLFVEYAGEIRASTYKKFGL